MMNFEPESTRTKIRWAYLASPYGFYEATRKFMDEALVPILEKHGLAVLNPWDLSLPYKEEMRKAHTIKDYDERVHTLHQIDKQIGRDNIDAIRQADIIVAVLDGPVIDVGVASEIGFAFGLKKLIIAYKGDNRLAGENIGVQVNIQVQSFIEESGGKIGLSLEEFDKILGNILAKIEG
ncbi:MAG: nucleoside 2-deoxyribosyltransferase [Candidatus Hodarchaeota archaeon]